jgi:hypothetical protein
MDAKYLPYFFDGSKLASVLFIAGLVYKFIECYRAAEAGRAAVVWRGVASSAIWLTLSLGLLLMHVFIAFTRAHAREPDQPLGAGEAITFIGIHVGYILMGWGLTYWVGPKRGRMR